jgi:2,3-diketo-5-methylthio-1-phosphopentane phosphatase
MTMLHDSGECAVFDDFPHAWDIVCDFDGTITPFDVTDALLERFAAPEWLAVEQDWVDGIITARQCMERQVRLMRASRPDLDAFLDTVPIDPFFTDFLELCRHLNRKPRILSDGLDYAILRIFKNHGLAVKVAANRLAFLENNRFCLEFPHGADDCASGMCKCRVASRGRRILLIGDGRSDFCLAGRADFVLAKQDRSLLDYCRAHGIACSPYADFNDICGFIKEKAAETAAEHQERPRGAETRLQTGA